MFTHPAPRPPPPAPPTHTKAAMASAAPSFPEDPDEAVLRACLAEEDPGRVTGYGPAATAAVLSAAPSGGSKGSHGLGRPGTRDPGAAAGQGEDIIGRLIAVFGSVDLFIQEYR